MKSRHWIYLGLFVALITIIAFPIYFYNRPLDPPLELKPPPAAVASSAVEPAKAQLPITGETAAESQTSAGACGGSGLVNILYLWQNLPETPIRGTDLIRLIMVNYDTPSLAILSMPPDVLVVTNELEDVDSTTLTLAFWYGKQPPPQGERAALRRATQVVAQALLDEFDYTTERYMTMNQPVFGDMIDTMDGVWVYVGEYVDGRPELKGVFEPFPKPQLMDGDRALDYVRILQPAGQPDPNEWARFNRQNEVIAGIFDGIKDPGNWLKLPSLIGDFYSLLVTDLKPKELQSIYCMIDEDKFTNQLYQEVTAEELLNYTPGDEVMIPHPVLVTDLIKDMQEWTWTLVWPPEPEP